MTNKLDGFFNVLGILLSAVIMIPSLRSLGMDPLSLLINFALFIFVAAPFLILHFYFKRVLKAENLFSFSAPYVFCHLFLAIKYNEPSFRVQEFGFIGLIFLPFYESLIAVPIGLTLKILLKRWINRS